MLPLINAERKKKGLKTITLDQTLTEAALQRAAELALNFDHIRPDGRSALAITSDVVSENIWLGTVSANAKSAFDAWCRSSGHYNNMMNANRRRVGIGFFIAFRN